MTTKKPDRFERDVLRALKKQGVPLDPDGVTISLIGPDVVKLLRKEHRAVTRMVRRFGSIRYSPEIDARYVAGHRAMCKDILSKLTERGK